MTQERLKEIAERAERATPGPWIFNPEDVDEMGHYAEPQIFSYADPDNPRIVCDMAVGGNRDSEADGQFTAHARTDIPDLLTHIHTLEEQNGRLRVALAEVMGLVEAGELVRDVSHDGESGWMLKNMRLVRILADARRAALAPPAPAARTEEPL